MFFRTSRRSFLRNLSVGGATLVAPFLAREVRAQQGMAGPKRLLVIQTPDGQPGAFWKPSGTASNFTLGQTMQPYNTLKGDLILLEGINHRPGGGEPHCQSFVQWMTGRAGVTTNNYTAAQAPSVDQIIAAEDSFVGKTPFRSLQLAGDMTTISIDVSHRYMSWAGVDKPLPGEHRPLQNYTRIFQTLLPGGANAQAQAALAKQIRERKSVLDLLTNDGIRMAAVVPAAQKDYFESHLAAIRSLEMKLSSMTTTTNPECKAPDTMGFPTANDDSRDKLPLFWKTNTEIMRLTFACDLTRVMTFVSSPSTSNVVHNAWAPGMTSRAHHHDCTHGDMQDNLRAINLWYANRIAELVTGLKNTKDGATSLLDNMLVICGSEFGSGGVHSNANIPFVLFGKAGGSLQTGRYLSYLNAPRSSNDVWLSAFAAFGMPRATIGDPAKCGGVLPGFM
jgi:hypothetical protein